MSKRFRQSDKREAAIKKNRAGWDMVSKGDVRPQGELLSEATIRKFRIVQTEGNRQVGRRIEMQQQSGQNYIDNLKKSAELPSDQRKNKHDNN